MEFSTDPSDELPLALQLRWRLRAAISTGEWRSGERLPSLRRLAESAAVNVNTVRAVYARLGEQGLIVGRHGQGSFVADGVTATPRLEEIAVQALQAARRARLSPRELAIVALTRDPLAAEPAAARNSR